MTSTSNPTMGVDDVVQMLTPDGTRVPNSDFDAYAHELTVDDLKGFYRDMVLIRRVDAEGNALQRQGQLGLWVPLLGQEAAQIGLGRALRPQDYVFPTYREHGVAWCRGVAPETLLGIFRGQNHSGWDPKDNNFNVYTIVIGSQVMHATGYAMGVQMDGAVGTGDMDRDTIAVACCGDGATSQGDVSEALTFAGAFRSPVLFYVQNNQWAISEPNTVQTSVPLYTRGQGFGVPGVRVDGNDILAVYSVCRAYADRIRSGQGPMLIEAYTYRMGAHTTADDPTKYRDSAEVDAWKPKDPILRVRKYLENTNDVDAAFFTAIDDEADALAERIRSACVNMAPPPVDEIFDSVFVEPHPMIEEEQREYKEYLASFEDVEGDK
ncbi:pyruvate dehydrogenase (acetyl-transferring) E1 component subunit alpha [Brevibacterium paucivorans]|uniref:Pyruvate dehydrogenase (Acetyl-transferring) E1 component subunit alpha n=1 Tax=Brevibacterium paucivorans TaxID=170994 RepID=A0A2N6VL78_9MICO|nr:pyruvate dehydrogenase (acetyl-transferring) E1 component subunit alpha [Brevibacterium paucivorans]PMD04837.1 pyruvate dehydrogenase (acetyl-transferring) E1 component subunit alpha [Brevibacterium paucivorans]